MEVLAQHSPFWIQALATDTTGDIAGDPKKDNDILHPSERKWVESSKSEEPFAFVQFNA